MKALNISVTAALLAALAAPAFADPGNGKGHGRDKHRIERHDHDRDRDRDRVRHRDRDHLPVRYADGCPPGLAKKSPACVPPGQAKKIWSRGDYLRIEDYRRILDPRRYSLETRPGWDYYRDGNRAYRVDSDTRRILAVLELINAFSN